MCLAVEGTDGNDCCHTSQFILVGVCRPKVNSERFFFLPFTVGLLILGCCPSLHFDWRLSSEMEFWADVALHTLKGVFLSKVNSGRLSPRVNSGCLSLITV